MAGNRKPGTGYAKYRHHETEIRLQKVDHLKLEAAERVAVTLRALLRLTGRREQKRGTRRGEGSLP